MTYQASRPTASQPSDSPSASQPSGSVSSQASTNPTLVSSKPPKKKLLVRVDGDGQVVGENSAKFTTKAGKYIRSTIPIIFDKWPLVPSDFKDKLWRRLTDKFEFNVPEKLVRPKLEKHFPSIWSGAKSRYRTEIIRKAENLEYALQKRPDGVDPNHWSEFIFKQEDPKVQEACARNARNRSSYKGGHSLGRRSYAQRLDILKNKEPEKKHSRVNVWMVGCERADGTILDSVQDKYDKVKEVHSKQSENSSNDDIDNFVDINEDALTQVFGRDKRNRTRGVSSHISNKQFQQTAIAKVLLEQTTSSNA